ncbi:MAG TPA: hypothetical protein PKC28_02920 [Bdellovibrionales bacterium]|nr:hypothetical protein [Bdellovibrionales bacterium]
MTPFTCTFRTGPDAVILELAGALNENAKLPQVPTTPRLTINLDQVSQVNSVGIREWCGWIRKLPPTLKITLEGCPFLFVKSFSLIRGVLPSNAIVGSMYLPFYSEKTKEERSVLLKNGQHYSNHGLLELPIVKDTRGHLMEVDVTTRNYLAFLRES